MFFSNDFVFVFVHGTLWEEILTKKKKTLPLKVHNRLTAKSYVYSWGYLVPKLFKEL